MNEVVDKRRTNFFILDNEIIDYVGEIGVHAFAVYSYLVFRANKSNKTFPSQATIAKDLGISRKTVNQNLQVLQEKQLISISPRYTEEKLKRSSLYTVLPIKPDVTEGNIDVTEPDVYQGYIEQDPVLEQEKVLPNGNNKEIRKLAEGEAEKKWEKLTSDDVRGEDLVSLASLLAEENKTGKVAVTRVWREIGQTYVKHRDDYSPEAWAHGFEAALEKGAANLNYVRKAAAGYRPLHGQRNGKVQPIKRFMPEDRLKDATPQALEIVERIKRDQAEEARSAEASN
jgi:DNA-binding MarR family transcriptional regulator